MAGEAVHVWAVVRYDRFQEPGPKDDPSLVFTVKEVLPTAEEARWEADRLNSLRDNDRVEYFVVLTRYFPAGRGFTSND